MKTMFIQSRRMAVYLIVALALIVAALPSVALAAPPSASTAEAPEDMATSGFYYVVQKGDTLSSIAAQFGTTVSAIQQANGIKNADRIYVGQVLWIPRGAACAAYHVVRKGETLSGIAHAYGVSVRALQKANGIKNPDHIVAGKRLCIPWPPIVAPKGWYLVKRGDTLSAIAAHFRVSVSCLARVNGIKHPNRIFAGEMLKIAPCQ